MWRGIKCFIIVLVICLLAMAIISYIPMNEVGQTNVELSRETFTETAAQIDNPDRGMYSIIGFSIKDREEDYQTQVDRLMKDDGPTNLVMIQINLAHYRDRELSPTALKNISNLFDTLRTKDENWILRFLYDWDGNAEATEPESIDIILRHMEQLKDLLQANQDKIFVLQGLFTGNWGEMNGTHYGSTEVCRSLMEMLMQVTGENTFLSVRTGAQWRDITGIYQFEELTDGAIPRMGLYNDGIMGNLSDCGTYSNNDSRDEDPEAIWSREKELEFQNLLCRYVPNGGEVILNNPLNDYENAVATLRKMHISYLNYDYDKEILDKWAMATVEKGAYQGLDGLSYIERHLGYRILINDVKTAYHPLRQRMILDVELKNVGFAPVYTQKDVLLQIYDENNQLVYTHLFEQDIRQLYGGENSGDMLELHHEISLADWATGEFQVYLAVCDRETGEMLVLANEQTMTQYGYKIAGIRRS